jgi:hypothetical protein
MIAAMRARGVLGARARVWLVAASAPDAAVDHRRRRPCARRRRPASPDDPALAAQAGHRREYQSWGRIDDELRWAPWLCRIPLPGLARMSASSDSATHGQKLYSVFVKKRDAYPMGPHTDQVVVKESWTSSGDRPVGDVPARALPRYPDAATTSIPTR